MAEIKANLRYLRIAPRKLRLVANLVRGKSVKGALDYLKFSSKKSSPIIAKLVKSAASNAKNNLKIDSDNENIYIKKILIDEGPTYKRYMPRARGASYIIRKRTSHITVVLEERLKNKEPRVRNKKTKIKKT